MRVQTHKDNQYRLQSYVTLDFFSDASWSSQVMGLTLHQYVASIAPRGQRYRLAVKDGIQYILAVMPPTGKQYHGGYVAVASRPSPTGGRPKTRKTPLVQVVSADKFIALLQAACLS